VYYLGDEGSKAHSVKKKYGSNVYYLRDEGSKMHSRQKRWDLNTHNVEDEGSKTHSRQGLKMCYLVCEGKKTYLERK
jgi:hypothetical protein